jgi:tetratricopeptide (TPR) repeat protein
MYRHKRKILACLMQLLISGCIPRAAVQPLDLAGPHEEANTNSLTEYNRMVFKNSHEGAAQDSEAYDRLLKEDAKIEELAQHVDQNPNDLESKRQLALALVDHGLNRRAYELLSQLETALPADAVVALGMARVWEAWGDHGLARQYALRAIQSDAALAAAYDTLARIYLHTNDFSEAISAFLKAHELEPGNPIPLAEAGYAFLVRGDWQHAKTYLEQAIALDASLPEANNNLATALAQVQTPTEAMRAFQEALKAEPEYAAAKSNLQRAPQGTPKPPKSLKPPTIVQLSPWPAEKPASLPVTATETAATSRAKPAVAPVPAMPAAMPVALVAKPADSQAPVISRKSEMALPATSAKPVAPATDSAVLTPAPATEFPALAPEPAKGSPALTPGAVVLDESKSPDLTTSIDEPVATDSVVTPPSVPVAVETVNPPAGSNPVPLASNSDLDTKKQEQKPDAGRGFPISNAVFLGISILGSLVGDALARARGMLIGAALGPIVQVVAQICGLLS